MGCDPKKTLAQVKQDLYNQICSNALAQLKNRTGKVLASNTDIEDIMKPLAEWKFKDDFQFDFETDPTKYSTSDLPDALKGTIVAVHQLAPIQKGTDIGKFIDDTLLSKVGLPDWMAGNAKSALKTLALDLISEDTNDEVKYNSYKQAFDSTSEDDSSWEAKATLAFVTGSLLEDDLAANLTLIYFVGIYYKADSPTKKVRDGIQNQALAAATTYTSSKTPITTIAELKPALRAYSERSFGNQYTFPFASSTPPGIDKDASGAVNVNNGHFFQFQDLQFGDLKQSIEGSLVSGLDFGDSYQKIQELALDDITEHMQTALKDTSSDNWNDTFLSKTYDLKSTLLNRLKMDCVFVQYYGHGSAENSYGKPVEVSNRYIFCLVMVWELISPEKTVSRDIFKMMVNQLRTKVDPTIQENNNLDELEKYLNKYCSDRFYDEFNFKYDGDNSKPPDLFKTNVLGFKHIGDLEEYPVQNATIGKWVDEYFFPRTPRGKDVAPFNYATSSIYDDFNDSLVNRAANFPQDSNWSISTSTHTYEPSDQATQGVKVRTLFVTGLGDLTEEGVHSQRPFFYVMMVGSSVEMEGSTGGW